jgi:hypothetical protein
MLSRFGKTIVFLLALGMSALAQTVPAGTRITVRTDSQISSASAHVGQSFHANLVKDLVLDGKTIAKAGAPAKGRSLMPSQVDGYTPLGRSPSGLRRFNSRMEKLSRSQPAAFTPRERATPRAT